MEFKIKAQKREIMGKKVSQLRDQGMIPAVIYGHDFESTPLQLDRRSFLKILSETGETTIIDLEVQGEKNEKVLIHDIARDPVTGEILHIDFYRTQADQAMIVEVPLVFEGISLAVKDLGGILVTSLKNIKVRALPADLPHNIKIDISSLKNIEDHIKVSDIPTIEKVEFLADAEEMVASIEAPRSQEEIEALSEEVKEEVGKVEGVADKTEEGEAVTEEKSKES
ncbi:MAG: 50S ribosomal protein L25 [Candidatus Paceibacterota bacterium]|jgi:large subunit ribosomal protein L25